MGSRRDLILEFCETRGVGLRALRALSQWPLKHAEDDVQEAVMPREEPLARVAQLIPEAPTGRGGQGSPAVAKLGGMLK
jgi:hypothetical protein